MITKAILIKPADKWMVRVWETDDSITYPFGYREYEAHTDYVDRLEQEAMKKISFNYSFVNLSYDLINKGIDLNPELIGFDIECDNCGDIEVCDDCKTYAILKEVEQNEYSVDGIWVELFNDLDKWSRSSKSSKDTPIKINELKQKYTLKRR